MWQHYKLILSRHCILLDDMASLLILFENEFVLIQAMQLLDHWSMNGINRYLLIVNIKIDCGLFQVEQHDILEDPEVPFLVRSEQQQLIQTSIDISNCSHLQLDPTSTYHIIATSERTPFKTSTQQCYDIMGESIRA
ncbi:unnamed protein product [Absidia cylindrospora]